ncbi:Green-sensitive opsin-1 [Orchesella cincta]|uniref:Green-sensitive opsin-1 n=1 Tax=Orchesella cincta TaxID=48709 RepID=A0A1D2N152_ORCCI|nr:Green-sensitive opsin-1 [Orchesella cincta]
MISCFMIAWSPYAVVSLIVAFGGPRGRKLITPLASILPAIFAKSATCYNPLIYVGLNTQFRTAWMKLFGISREDMEAQTGLTHSAGGITQTGTAVPTHGLHLAGSPSPKCTTPNQMHPTSTDVHLPLSPVSDPTLAEEEARKLLSSKVESTDALELAPLERSKSTSPVGENTDIHLDTIRMGENCCDRTESIEL